MLVTLPMTVYFTCQGENWPVLLKTVSCQIICPLTISTLLLTFLNFMIPEQLASILDECDEIYNDMSADEVVSKSQWQKSTTSSDSNWENWRDQLFSAVLHSCVIPEGEVMCVACGNQPAVVKCSTCIVQYLCPDCDDATCEKPLHDRQEWLNGFFNYLKPEQSVSREREIIIKGTITRVAYFILVSVLN